jgi:hypothetical protein
MFKWLLLLLLPGAAWAGPMGVWSNFPQTYVKRLEIRADSTWTLYVSTFPITCGTHKSTEPWDSTAWSKIKANGGWSFNMSFSGHYNHLWFRPDTLGVWQPHPGFNQAVKDTIFTTGADKHRVQCLLQWVYLDSLPARDWMAGLPMEPGREWVSMVYGILRVNIVGDCTLPCKNDCYGGRSFLLCLTRDSERRIMCGEVPPLAPMGIGS